MPCPECNHLRRAEGGLKIGGLASVNWIFDTPCCNGLVWPDAMQAEVFGGATPGTHTLNKITGPHPYWEGLWINDAIDVGSPEGTGIVLGCHTSAWGLTYIAVYPTDPLFNPDSRVSRWTGLICDPFHVQFALEGSSAGISVIVTIPIP